MVAKEITVKGKVQGVFFRASTKELADQLGIRGEVCNLRDGNVWIAAEGDAESIDKFVDWCRHGPLRARVEALIINDSMIKGYTGFTISR